MCVKENVLHSIGNEWKRLCDAEAAEKANPENTGCVIRLDIKERKLYRDGVVTDGWRPAPLQEDHKGMLFTSCGISTVFGQNWKNYAYRTY